MKYTQILWDFNGTILDDVQTGIDCVNLLLERRHLPLVDSVSAYRSAFCFPITKYYENVGLDLKKEPFSRLAVEWVAEYNKAVHRATIRPGVYELNRALRAAGLRQVVLSATEARMLEGQLQTLALLPLFDDFVGMDNIHAESKVALAQNYLLGTDPATCLFLGDTEHDYEVARAVGADCILLTGGHQSREKLLACGCPVADSFDAVRRLILN